jgi:hypothetical protein
VYSDLVRLFTGESADELANWRRRTGGDELAATNWRTDELAATNWRTGELAGELANEWVYASNIISDDGYPFFLHSNLFGS